MTKIVLVSLYYERDRVTGANKRFDEIGKRLRSRGELYKLIVTEGQEPHWCPAEHCVIVRPYNSAVTRMASFIHLNWLLLGLDCAIVITDFMPVPLIGLMKHRHVQLIHDLRSFTPFGRYGSRLSSTFQKFQLRRCPEIVTVSQWSKREVVQYCNVDDRQVLVSYNGINFEESVPKPFSERDIDIFYVATFEARKNHELLIEALHSATDPLRVVFLGKDLGSREFINKSVNMLAAANSSVSVEILDSVSEEELRELYRRTKLFVSPSVLEGFGMPLVEAMNYGCKVVCSDIPVFREVCDDYAYYFKYNSKEDLERKLVEAFWDGEGSSHRALEKFSWDIIVSKLVDDLTA